MTWHPILKRDIDHEELARGAEERLRAEREVTRKYRRELLRVCLELLASAGAGLVFLFGAFYVADRDIGQILLLSGLIVAYSGILLSLALAYLRGEARGDW